MKAARNILYGEMFDVPKCLCSETVADVFHLKSAVNNPVKMVKPLRIYKIQPLLEDIVLSFFE